MDVFELRHKIILNDYARYTASFFTIDDDRIRQEVDDKIRQGLLWPEPLLQLNPSFQPGGMVDDLVRDGTLDPRCGEVFRIGKDERHPAGRPMQLYQHQKEAIAAAQRGESYVLTTGTGSGKSLSYIIPIVDYVLRQGSGKGIKAIVVYPMNALANSQEYELDKFLGGGGTRHPVTYRRYTGQEDRAEKSRIADDPPDILLTNYMMLEYILTRPDEKRLVDSARNLEFLVFDELHTYRGRQGADVAMLIRRLRAMLGGPGGGAGFRCVGTSATLAGDGTFDEKRQAVAAHATRLFGSPVTPDSVIMETLQAETSHPDWGTPRFAGVLRDALNADEALPEDPGQFIHHPLAVWIENEVGLVERDGRLERCAPRPLKGPNGLAPALAELTGVDEARCETRLRGALLDGANITRPANGRPVFAFRLHQFLSKGDTVYATVEPEASRTITLFGQRFAPNHEGEAALFPLRFCRDCGKEFYAVHQQGNDENATFLPLNPALPDEEGGVKGYLFISADNPWPDSAEEQACRAPEDWFEEKKKGLAPKSSRKKYLPQAWHVRADGTAVRTPEPGTTPAWFMAAPLQFCPECGVSYAPRVSEFTKLATLGSEGRSTATTILSMSTVNHLLEEDGLDDRARKFLCFSDNRQDASLQSGHFNDFVQVALVRSALCRALEKAGPAGIGSTDLPMKVFEALGEPWTDGRFPPERYASSPGTGYSQPATAAEVFRKVIEFRLYTDMRRTWRIVSPNLEQCGLLLIEYVDLDKVCADDKAWRSDVHLAAASPDERFRIAKEFLDLLRTRLIIAAKVLTGLEQETLVARSGNLLIDPWALEEDDCRHSQANMAYARARKAGERSRDDFFISAMSRFGRWLRRPDTLPGANLSSKEVPSVIACLMSALSGAAILKKADRTDTGFQIQPEMMRWKAGDGTRGTASPLTSRRVEGKAAPTNPFFVSLYRTFAGRRAQLSSREHTAQVPGDLREEREKDFREARLPVLYCSPTMELGVDISDLNAVGMRNVPPTPANYAQRGGRAGRSGQPALIITYCAQGSAHDQYFFQHPEQMVAGAVSTPRIDLDNEDLIRAHVHALWLSAAELKLGQSLRDIIDLGDVKDLPLTDRVRDELENPAHTARARAWAGQILNDLAPELSGGGWYNAGWLDETLKRLPRDFENACGRWRGLYHGALAQQRQQNDVIMDVSRSQDAKNTAKRLRDAAEKQLELLREESPFQSDFYPYRYLASEGFLPGYNFPRLPLSAYIPGRRMRRGGRGGEEYLSRPRFLAISEFGPNSIIYHEGAKYVIDRVIMDTKEDGSPVLVPFKQCGHCGWIERDTARDVCDMCGEPLPDAMRNMFRMRSVSTRQRELISSDEEERQRFGYRLTTGYHFEERDGMPAHRDAVVFSDDGSKLAGLKYGQAATIYRINLGWASAADDTPPGFKLDTAKGIWVKDAKRKSGTDVPAGDDDLAAQDPKASLNVERVIPYVEDNLNCLVFEPMEPLNETQMVSLHAALKQAVQQVYQLEDFELGTEVLPSSGTPERLLFVESSEGGAGVLRRLVEDASAMAEVARTALEICHFDAAGGRDLEEAKPAEERCVAACYRCLMNYGNQKVHAHLNRHVIREYLRAFLHSRVVPSGGVPGRTDHLAALKGRCDSGLERSWLDFLEDRGLRLPDEAQHFFEPCRTRPDFWYEEGPTAVYIDGPVHEYPDRAARDLEQQECLEDMGVTVIRFAAGEQWIADILRHPAIFGKPAKRGSTA